MYFNRAQLAFKIVTETRAVKRGAFFGPRNPNLKQHLRECWRISTVSRQPSTVCSSYLQIIGDT
jgi:hypothetical protein